MTTAIAHRQLVALAPQDVPAAQQQLIDWCREHITALGRELREQRINLREAKRMLWRHHGWTTAITRTKKRMVYFAKIQAAVRAGYLIVPNFNVETIAVRVGGAFKGEDVDVHQASADILPTGQGRYVDDRLIGHNEVRKWTDSAGNERSTTDFHPTDYDEQLDFPATLVKPVVLDATQRAMALRIFDRIGIVRQSRRSDPIVVGQILDPRTPKGWSRRNNPKCVTFFVAWWLNTQDLV